MPRTAGKTGRQPALQGAERLAIPWVHDVLATTSVTATYPVNVTQGITDCLMLGNGPDNTITVTIPGFPKLAEEGCGDCFFAAFGHDQMLAGAQVNANGTVTLYFKYDKDQDLGVVVANALLWLYQQGLIEAFGPVHPDSIDWLMQTFGRGVLLGANLTPNDMPSFGAEPPVPWAVTAENQPDPREGHVVYKVVATNAHGDGGVWTWGGYQEVLASWFDWQPTGAVEEAWLVLTKADKARFTPEQWATLVGYLDALPGATPPVDHPPVDPPAPGPVSPPSPAPGPEPAPPTPPTPPKPPHPGPPPVDPPVDPVWKEWIEKAIAYLEKVEEEL